MPMQQGDVPITYAKIDKAKDLLNYDPKTPIEEGMKKITDMIDFVASNVLSVSEYGLYLKEYGGK